MKRVVSQQLKQSMSLHQNQETTVVLNKCTVEPLTLSHTEIRCVIRKDSNYSP